MYRSTFDLTRNARSIRSFFGLASPPSPTLMTSLNCIFSHLRKATSLFKYCDCMSPFLSSWSRDTSTDLQMRPGASPPAHIPAHLQPLWIVLLSERKCKRRHDPATSVKFQDFDGNIIILLILLSGAKPRMCSSISAKISSLSPLSFSKLPTFRL